MQSPEGAGRPFNPMAGTLDMEKGIQEEFMDHIGFVQEGFILLRIKRKKGGLKTKEDISTCDGGDGEIANFRKEAGETTEWVIGE